ncbi:MAG: SIR2 family protein [Nitrospira sp.]|nr:SIR2 family protein [Nitrospira sp.]
MQPSQFARMLRSLYVNVPVPAFYRDVAALVRERYFPLIVTTNFDTLLEQALAQTGVRSSDYKITTIGTRTFDAILPSEEPLTHIVKLHGDLAQDTAYVSPEQIDDALRTSRQWIKSDLVGDIIMVAHVVDNADPINKWLAHGAQRELWWVSQESPPPQATAWASVLRVIDGDLGRTGVFLSQLALRLLSAPDSTANDPAEDLPSVESLLASPRERPILGDETLEREIFRNQSLLYSLDQATSPRERNPDVQAQIVHQKRVIVKLEDRARARPDTQQRVLQALGSVLNSVANGATIGKGAIEVVEYIRQQQDTLKQEFDKPKPNQIVVSAALGATLAVADRMLTEFGPEVISPDDVRRLAAFIPSAAGKVVL